MVERLKDNFISDLLGREAAILDAVGAGITVQTEDGRLVYANQLAAELAGWASAEQMLSATPAEIVGRFELIDEDGRPLAWDRLPGRRVLAGDQPEPQVVGFRSPSTGEERWSVVRATALAGGPDGMRYAVNTFHDLTSQIQAAHETRRSEQRYREIVDALPIVAWLTDPAGHVVTANGRWLELTGMPSPTGARIEQHGAVHEADRLDLEAAWQAAAADRRPFECVVRLRAADDTWRWHLVRGAPLLRDGGDLDGWISTATDIELERAASQAVSDSEHLFHDLTDSAPMLIWMAGPDRDATFFNRGWLVFTGRRLDEAVAEGWLADVHPDDRERVERAWEEAFAAQRPFEQELRIRRNDGAWRWLLTIGRPRLDADGEFIGFIGTGVDVDERRRAADLAALLAEATVRLDETIGLEETVEAAARVAIPAIADWCVIDLLVDGEFRRMAVVAGDPETQTLIEPMRDFPVPLASRRPGPRVVGERRPLVLDLTDDDALRQATAGDEGLAAVIRGSGAGSAIVQPLLARGDVLGVIFFVVGTERTLDETDLATTGEVARRIALPIANAMHYAGELRARQAAEAAATRIERLQRVTRRLVEARSRQAVTELVVREGGAALGASGAVILLVDAAGELRIVASEGYSDEQIEPFRSISLESGLPLAEAARTSRPVWLPDMAAIGAVSEIARGAIGRSSSRSACAVPIVADGRTFGTLGLSFRDRTDFDEPTRSLIGAYADLCAQALARIMLGEIREELLADLEAQQARLETVLRQLPEGLMIAEAPSGRVVLGNDRLESILGVPSTEVDHLSGHLAYRGFDATGRELEAEDWPLARAVRGETVDYLEIEILRPDGNRVWIAKRASPVLDRAGRVIAGVATVIDISDARRARETEQFLAGASDVLASSLDYESTLRRVADLAVPRMADWCAVEIVDETGSTRRLAVTHVDPARVELVRRLTEDYPPDPESPGGVAEIIRTRKSVFVPEIPDEMLAATARDERHLELIRSLELHSYIGVPLIAGGRVLGVLTLAAAESERRFTTADLAVAESLASRAAAAIDNARLFSEGVRFKQVLDATIDAVLMFDPRSLAISYVNQGAIDLLGIEREALLGQTVDRHVDELDAISLRGLLEPLLDGSGGSVTATIPFILPDDRRAMMEVRLQLVAPPGETPRVLAVARDIRERIEVQERLVRLAAAEHARAAELDAVIRAMGDGVVVCAADGRITLANPAAEDLFPQIVERSYADIIGQLVDTDHEAPQLGMHAGPVELQTREGERWIELSTYRVGGRVSDPVDDREVETIVILRDVTAQRQAQAVRDTFIGVLSHELRTPVTTIFAGSKVLARPDAELDEATRREIFSDIVTESERLHRLVEDVIAMTRFGEGAGDVGAEPVLLQRLLPPVVRSEEPRWPGVGFRVDLAAGIPTIVADPTYVEQVLRNLLSNAAKYGGQGTTVEILVEPAGDEVLVRIQDDGPGFPEDETERLFELFFRSARTSRAAAGAGIGLFVCARLISAMGGRIWARNREGGGAEFGFALRIMPAEA